MMGVFVCQDCEKTFPDREKHVHKARSYCEDCYEALDDIEDDDEDDDDSGLPAGYGGHMGRRTPSWADGEDDDGGPWGKAIREQLPSAEYVASAKRFECPTCENSVRLDHTIDLDPYDTFVLDCAECEQWEATYDLMNMGTTDIVVEPKEEADELQ